MSWLQNMQCAIHHQKAKRSHMASGPHRCELRCAACRRSLSSPRAAGLPAAPLAAGGASSISPTRWSVRGMNGALVLSSGGSKKSWWRRLVLLRRRAAAVAAAPRVGAGEWAGVVGSVRGAATAETAVCMHIEQLCQHWVANNAKAMQRSRFD